MELPGWDPASDQSTISVNMADMYMYICPILNKKSYKYTHTLKCDMCQYTFHKNCRLLTKTELGDFMQSGSQDWTCGICAESLFLFNHAVENGDFLNILMNSILYQYLIIMKLCIR